MKNEELGAAIYLWTRDAGLPVRRETENYVIEHLGRIRIVEMVMFSDKDREAMVIRIMRKLEL